MLTRDFPLKVKALEDSGTFTGIASPYGGEPDLQGDLIEAGAFSQAVAQQGKGYPLLWSHRQDEPIGIARVEDSKDALICHGSLVMDDPAARRAYQHMKAGSVKGLSIGYLVPGGQGKSFHRQDGVRVLREVKLFEISVVAVPAAPRAQITSIKSLGDVRQLLHALRDDQVDEEALSQLEAIDYELKRLRLNDVQQQTAVLKELQAFAIDLQRLTGR